MIEMKKIFALLLPFAIISCEKDVTEDIDNDPEVMTTVKVIMEPSGGITDAEFLYQDTDGTGGSDPVIKTDTLFTNTTYEVRAFFLNERVNPVDSLNGEILEEADDHQVFLEFDPDLGLSTSYRDTDIDGDPLGLRMQVVTDSTTGTSQMTLTLIHEPLKDAEGVSEGDLTNADGDIDMKVHWDVYIQ